MAHASPQLRQARLGLGLTQLELAARAGVSCRTIQFAESGRSVANSTLRRIASAMDMECDQLLRIDPGTGKDAFMDLPWSIADRFRNNRFSERGSCCRNEAEVVSVVRELRENFAVQIQKWGTAEKQGQALLRDEAINETYFRYEQRYLECWRKNPNCIQVDRVDDTVCGVSIVLPLTANCFESFRAGKTAWLDIGADDIVEQSQYLLLDSVTEFVNRCRRPWYQVTETLSFISLAQVAELAIDPSLADFDMVSFSASPLNERRLTAIGFAGEQVAEPEFGHQIFWFGENTRVVTREEYSNWATFRHFASLVKSIDSKALRRRMMRSLLSTVKRRRLWSTARSLTRQAA